MNQTPSPLTDTFEGITITSEFHLLKDVIYDARIVCQ